MNRIRPITTHERQRSEVYSSGRHSILSKRLFRFASDRPPIKDDYLKGPFMTLCIAAIAKEERKLICACDFLLSVPEMSADGAYSKVAIVGETTPWAVMFAGDPTHAWAIVERAKEALSGKQGTFDEAADAFKSAFQEQLHQKINDELLSPFGMTREGFIFSGREALGEKLYSEILYSINGANLGTDLLIGNSTTLFSVVDPGIIKNHDPMGFHAIGMGKTLADASLTGTFDDRDSTEAIIYRLLEAKFKGEAAHGVGGQTFVVVIDENGTVRRLATEGCEKIRALWERKGRPKVPRGTKEIVEQFLESQSSKEITSSTDQT